jgi:ATP-dependent Clp protease ATP-binding subunit ClpB
MNLNKFTEKAQEAVIQAQALAEEFSHSEMLPRHLLLALLQQEGGVVPQIAHHLSVNPDTLAQTLETELQGEPKVYGGSRPGLSRALNNVLRK